MYLFTKYDIMQFEQKIIRELLLRIAKFFLVFKLCAPFLEKA
jgi:hypothetical protein